MQLSNLRIVETVYGEEKLFPLIDILVSTVRAQVAFQFMGICRLDFKSDTFYYPTAH